MNVCSAASWRGFVGKQYAPGKVCHFFIAFATKSVFNVQSMHTHTRCTFAVRVISLFCRYACTASIYGGAAGPHIKYVCLARLTDGGVL